MAIDIKDVPKELSNLTMMMGRRPDSPHEDSEGHFAGLGSFNGAAINVGGFQGTGCWERHTKGDEFFYILDGETNLVVMQANGPETVHMGKGSFYVMPPGVWHRSHSKEGVTLMALTPQPTDHFYGEDPRKEG
jgi:mannose-6-phosphate isomerase-like protein (cupin superfamily)